MSHTLPQASTLPTVQISLCMAGVPRMHAFQFYGGPSCVYPHAADALDAILREFQDRLSARHGEAVDDMRDGLSDRAAAMRDAMGPLQSLQRYCPDGHPAILEWGFTGDRSGYGATVTVTLRGGGAA